MSTVRRLGVWVGAVALLVALTAASVAMIAPDALRPVCDRPHLVPPVECVTGATRR